MTYLKARTRIAAMMFWKFALLAALLGVSSIHAEGWPQWRGPRGDGTSHETNVPTFWNGKTGEGIAWKAHVPGSGHSSPIVHGRHLFLTSCLLNSQQRVLLCFDVERGKLI